jgi:hypothetical protein
MGYCGTERAPKITTAIFTSLAAKKVCHRFSPVVFIHESFLIAVQLKSFMNLRNLLLLLPFVVVLSACNLDDSEKEIIVTLETDFTVIVLEDLSKPGALQFEVRTTEMRPCTNSTIGLDIDKIGDEISLFINEVSEPADCEVGEAPAKGTVGTDIIPDGVLGLNVSLQNAVENQGTIELTDDRFIVQMGTQDGVSFAEREFFKIPEGIIWGYFAFDESGGMGEEVQEIIQTFEDTNLAAGLVDGHYGYFKTNAGEINWMRSDTEKSKLVSFVYQAGTNLDETINLLVDFKEGHPESELEAGLFLWDGRSF